jgi:hypothetical protein
MGNSQNLNAFESQSQSINAKAQRRKGPQRSPMDCILHVWNLSVGASLRAMGRSAVGFSGVSHA